MTLSRLVYSLIAIIILVFVLYLIGYAVSMSKTPTTTYATLWQSGKFSVRGYPKLIVAETHMPGARDQAARGAFQKLAGYIFGRNNDPTSNTPTKIKMTTPVVQQPTQDGWNMYFVMPTTYSRQSLPTPLNKTIHIRTIPPTPFLALRFSGAITTDNIMHARERLLAFAKDHQIELVDQPIFAFYNPPWTLPFMRKNEVMAAIKSPEAVVRALSKS